MRITIPFTQFEIRGHRPAPTGSTSADADAAGKRTFLPLKIKRRPDWAVLHQWAEKGPPDEQAERRTVARQLINFMANPRLTTLSVYSGSTITAFPPFPAKLQELDLVGCHRLIDPPDLTQCKNLVRLDMQDCRSLRAPPVLAQNPNLRLLNLDNCHHLQIAPDLATCRDLDTFSMAGCRNMTTGPDLSACSRLRFVNMSNCTSMSELPPLGVQPQLRELNLTSTRLQRLPGGLLALPRSCTALIDLTGIPIPHQEFFYTAIAQPGFAGPQLTIQGGYSITMRLADQVNLWRNETAGGPRGVPAHDWNQFEPEEHASSFTQFLTRLRETKDYVTHSRALKLATQRRVAAVLGRMEADSHLRGACFNLAADAVETCGDRVALRFMDMETMCNDAKMDSDIRKGVYDQQPQHAIDQFKGHYRLQVLEDEASKKTGTPGFADDVEVKLAYIMAFNEKYALPAHIRTMLFPRCAQLTEEDKDIARRKISNHNLSPEEQQKNNRAFRNFLASSPLMNALLDRWDKDAMTAARAQSTIQIQHALEKADADMERLMDAAAASGKAAASPEFKTQCDDVARQRAIALQEIPVSATYPVVEQFLQAHQLDAGL